MSRTHRRTKDDNRLINNKAVKHDLVVRTKILGHSDFYSVSGGCVHTPRDITDVEALAAAKFEDAIRRYHRDSSVRHDHDFEFNLRPWMGKSDGCSILGRNHRRIRAYTRNVLRKVVLEEDYEYDMFIGNPSKNWDGYTV